MLARLYVLTPFTLTVPEGEQFPLYAYEDCGYQVQIYPPVQSELLKTQRDAEQIKINGVPTFQADIFRVNFYKESFAREANGPCDPPIEVMERAINSFIVRLRYVVRAADIRSLKLSENTWRLEYLNDDGTEIEVSKTEIRGRGTNKFSIGWIALTKEIWRDAHALSIYYQPPPWDELLLDAAAELPKVGTAIVLASTALEVFIAQVLDHMAPHSEIPERFWIWINKRSDISRNPTVEEQYDILLSLMTGHSLKEEKELWDSFKHLKTARNSFVHEGVAKLGGAAIEPNQARIMVGRTVEIIQKVREWLPETIHWPEYKYELNFEITKKLN